MWERRQFPGAWQVLDLSTRIVKRMLFPKKQWLANHSNLPKFEYARTHLKGGNADRLSVWTGLEEDAVSEALCDKPTPEWYASIKAEDEQNVRDLEKLDDILKENGVVLENASAWAKGLKALKEWVPLFKAYKSAYFAIRLHQSRPTAISTNDIRLLLDDLERTCQRFRRELPDFKLHTQLAWETHEEVIQSLKEQIHLISSSE